MNAAGSSLHTSELAEAIADGPGDVIVMYADGDFATIERVESGPGGVVLFTATESLQSAMKGFVERLEEITELPAKGVTATALKMAAQVLLKDAQAWTN